MQNSTRAGKGKEQHPVDNQSIAIALAILREANVALPNEKVIAAANLESPVLFWTTLQSAMEVVEKSIPSTESVSLAERMNAARKRVEKHEQTITDAIAGYKTAVADYEQSSLTGSQSYSIIEIAKLKVADAFLESRHIPTGPRKLSA